MRKIIYIILLTLSSLAYSNILNESANFIKPWEGFARTHVKDLSIIDNREYVGYGTSVEFSKQYGYNGYLISKKRAEYILKIRISQNIKELRNIVDFDNMPMNVQVAVISAYYNSPLLVGPNLIKFLNNKDYEGASLELAWGHNPRSFYGLVKRRFAEANLIRRYLGLDELYTPVSIQHFNILKLSMYPVS
jgi:GH24 family phage-related lysozyme (muramidase)